MTERLDIYKCEICGTIVQALNRGDGELACCGQPMKYLQKYRSEDELKEKHVPIFMNDKIQVGSIPHPMIPEHHIKFIETISDDKKRIEIEFLDVTDNPEMKINNQAPSSTAIEYCNLHGLWEGKK